MLRPRIGRLLLALGLLAVFIIGIVVLVGELWVKPALEDHIAAGIVDELGLTATPVVEMNGFPLVLQALQEELDSIDVSARGEVFHGLRVESIDLHIDRVSFDSGDLLRRSGTVRISGGDGSATITDEDLSAYLRSVGLEAAVEFTSGTVRVSGPVSVSGIDTQVTTTGTLGLTDGGLTFAPVTVDLGALSGVVDPAVGESVARSHFAFRAPVPDLHGVRLLAVRVDDRVATIDAAFDALDVAY